MAYPVHKRRDISALNFTHLHLSLINHISILQPSLQDLIIYIYNSSTIIMSDGNNNASTGQSYLDQATGLAQRAMGTVTGDSSTQVSIYLITNNPTLSTTPY
jgi:hypothetical protein